MDHIAGAVAAVIFGLVQDGIVNSLSRNSALKNWLIGLLVSAAFAAFLWFVGAVSALWFVYLPGAVTAFVLAWLAISAIRRGIFGGRLS